MGAISNFVAAFERDFHKYSAVEKRVEELCRCGLQDTIFLWHSRVKAPASLKKKLKDRSNRYEDEAANVADIWDLVGGMIIVAHCEDIPVMERIVKATFNFIRQTQHPMASHNKVDATTRFRGYNGLHLYVTLQDRSNEQCLNPFIEIQVITGFMWQYAKLEHDVVYKRQRGEPTEDLLRSIDLLRGSANIGELALEMIDKLLSQPDLYSDLPTRVQSVISEGAFSELGAQSQSVLQLTKPQRDKDRAEPSVGQRFEDSELEECVFVLLRKQTRNKETYLEGVAKARQALLQEMTTPSRDGLPSIRHLRILHYLAVAERKLSLNQGLDAVKKMKHLDQAEAYMDEAVGLDMLSGLVGAREQITLEQHIVRGLRVKLEFRMHVRNAENTRMLLKDAISGMNQALKDLKKVDIVKFEKNEEFAVEWICYFRRLHLKF